MLKPVPFIKNIRSLLLEVDQRNNSLARGLQAHIDEFVASGGPLLVTVLTQHHIVGPVANHIAYVVALPIAFVRWTFGGGDRCDSE